MSLRVELSSLANETGPSNGTTTTAPPHYEDDSLFVIIPVVVILILLILSLLVYFMIKQRRLIRLKRDVLAMYEIDPCEEEWESLSNSYNFNHNRNYNTLTGPRTSRRTSSESRYSLEETTLL